MKDERAPRELRVRLREFALRIMHLGDAMPRTRSANVIANQLIKAGTSVGAHYREAARARSDAECISKLETGLQELDETDHWLELIDEGKFFPPGQLDPLKAETNELIAILVTCVKKIKSRSRA
jgi:four helix bundle protein